MTGIYDRTDPSKGYEKHLFRAGKGLQSAELNEIQSTSIARATALGDAIFKDGDLVRDCQCLVDPLTGDTILNSGELYLRGAVRAVAAAQFVVPIVGTVLIGIWLLDTTVTELQDPALRDPAVGTRNFGEAGAARLKVTQTWGWNGDGSEGEFYPVYTVENGVLLSKEPPPVFDGVTQAIARYDRDSAGGRYIVNGLAIKADYDRMAESLTILIGEGNARVNGYPVTVPRGVRQVYVADPDLKEVTAEPKVYDAGVNPSMRVTLDNAPLIELQEVRATVQKTITLTHGAFAGASDPLPDNSVVAIISVSQGGTTYVQGTDYTLSSGDVNWSPAGAEPAPGSSYQVTYQYISTTAFTITDVDDTGFSISGVVTGSVFTIDYTFAMPRIDAIVLDVQGRLVRLKGVSSQYNPSAPSIPETQLKIGSLYNDWFGSPRVVRDAVVVLPMDEIQQMRGLIFDLYDLVGQERLRNDVSLADPSAKRGLFVDPFNNDNLRDAGIVQNLAIVDGELMLPIIANVLPTKPTVEPLNRAILLNYTLETIIEQPFRTGDMLINPYQAFEPIPATLELRPAVDFWTDVETVWASEITRRFVANGFMRFIFGTRTTTTTELVSTSVRPAEFLRPIEVQFSIRGFGAGEILDSMTFDGIPVTPVEL